MRLVLSNVDNANARYDALIAFVRHEQPDILITQEINEQWLEALKILSEQLPYHRALPREDGSGIGLYSRLPTEELDVVFFGSDMRPGIRTKIRLGKDEELLSLLTIHPHAPISRNHFEYRNELLRSASSAAQSMLSPKILIGDLNTALWSPYYADTVERTGLMDARKGYGLLPTWPTFMPLQPILMLPIDHCLISNDIKVIDIRTGPDIGSDHLPLIIDLEIAVKEKEDRLTS